MVEKFENQRYKINIVNFQKTLTFALEFWLLFLIFSKQH
jgi:hypothetical protein